MKPRIVLAGGSGFIGQSLSPFLISKNYEVIALTRAESDQRGAVRNAHWDGKTLGDWIQFLNGGAVVVNLTGRSINCRHTPENRHEIIDSRVDSVRVLGQAIEQCTYPPQVFVQIAGVGIYGDKGERICDETTAPGDDFVAEVCQRWEAAFDSVDASKRRKVLLRLGVVLGPKGGFVELLGRLTRWFLGGQVGSGRQYISWIHIADLSRMVWYWQGSRIRNLAALSTPPRRTRSPMPNSCANYVARSIGHGVRPFRNSLPASARG
jgi:uncharacterized protein (TIGR01777 family)